MPPFPSRTAKILLLAGLGLAALILILLLTLPASLLKGRAEAQLSTQFGSPATIATLAREGGPSLSPVLRVTGIRVAQPAWVGPGDLATIGELRLRVHLLTLLSGHLKSELLSARGVRLDLVRAADGRRNWRPESSRDVSAAGGLNAASIEDAMIRYRDAKENRVLAVGIRIDPATGLFLSGSGTIGGLPVTLRAHGGPMLADRPWPFTGAIDGAALTMRARGSMAAPLHTSDMHFAVRARADDLMRIDRVIEAGLFSTQPITLQADVTRRPESWIIRKLDGTVGRSPFAGQIDIRKVDGRTKLDGAVRFSRLDFDDLSDDAGLSKAAATERALGPRLVPNTRINIRKIDRTDGVLRVAADRVIGGRSPSTITSASGVLTMDDRVLTIAPLHLGLGRAVIDGKAIVDQRDDAPQPLVTLALDLGNASLSALADGKAAGTEAPVIGRVRLKGRGDTVREAVGRANGAIGLVARSGSLPAKTAAMLGFDIGRMIGGRDGRTALRCAILRLDMRGGRGAADPLLIDTATSQLRGQGTITFPAEALDLTMTGAPKGNAALRLPGAIYAQGTIEAPSIVAPQKARPVATLLTAVKHAVAGENTPAAGDVDCAGAERRALAF